MLIKIKKLEHEIGKLKDALFNAKRQPTTESYGKQRIGYEVKIQTLEEMVKKVMLSLLESQNELNGKQQDIEIKNTRKSYKLHTKR